MTFQLMNSLLKIENNKEKEVTTLRIVISLVLIASTIFVANIMSDSPDSNAQQTAPAYAKWGRIVMEKVKEKYAQANIIDYLHIGREIGDKTTTEKFKLWLREGNREFGVYVDIIFDNETEEVIDILYRETDR